MPLHIIRRYDTGTIAVGCAFCTATGQEPSAQLGASSSHQPCQVCEGKSFNLLDAHEDATHDCALCRGTGKSFNIVGLFNGKPCTVCHGTGYIAVRLLDPFWEHIHSEVQRVARRPFEQKQYADSVEAAFKHVNSLVKALVKAKLGTEFDGKPLMERAFSPGNPVVRLADLSTDSGQNIQLGYMLMFSGAMVGIRNPKAHDNITIDRERAIHHLFLASLLLSKFDESKEFETK